MATNYSPSNQILTYKCHSSITYDRTKKYGSDLAGYQLHVELVGDKEIRMVTAGSTPLGELLNVSSDGYGTVVVRGKMRGRQGAIGGAAVGHQCIGATGPSRGGQTNGYLATSGTDADSRIMVEDVTSNTAGGLMDLLV